MELCECQVPGLQRISEGNAEIGPQPLVIRLKLSLAKPWNYQVKPALKIYSRRLARWRSARAGGSTAASAPTVTPAATALQAGDLVLVRTRQEI